MWRKWLQGGNDWYYLNPISGHMQKGWLQGINTWYYFNYYNGKMYSNAFLMMVVKLTLLPFLEMSILQNTLVNGFQ